VKDKGPRKEKLSIYLAKINAADDRDIIKVENAGAPISVGMPGAESALYIKLQRQGSAPSWTKFFTNSPDIPPGVFGTTRTVGAVLVVRRNGRTYALSFGTGFHLLKDGALERDFGLRVALNSVEPTKLRSVDKASYDHNPLNSRTQSTIDVDIFDLDMDSELEMLYAVTGASRVSLFGKQVTGRDALTLMVEVTLETLPKILDEAMSRYTAKLPAEFDWVDNVRRVKDETELGILDLLLDDALQDPSKAAALWLGEPEVVDWEAQYGYSFDLYPNTPRHVVLQLSALEEYLAEKGQDLSIDSVRLATVHVNNSAYEPLKSWPAYRCLYAEIRNGNDTFVLRNGHWYRVDVDFVQRVDKYLAIDLKPYDFKFPTYEVDAEEQYNSAVASTESSVSLMDRKTAGIGGPYDKVELCDLIRNRTDLIHVKYYRSSSTLSHLFAQGYVAAEAFVKDEEFRRRVNDKLPRQSKLVDPSARPDAKQFRVVYAIATTKQLPNELPFFSKVTLRNALKTLVALGYQVHLSSIDVDPKVLAKKKYKPRGKNMAVAAATA
jgi:uncharacterized protein (TIGR04141 family)